LGNVWTLTEIWKELGFSDLRRVFRRTRHTIDVEALIRIMVLNRLCDPESKLGVLRWLQTVALPDVELKAVTHQQLLRSMDALMDNQDAVDSVVAGLLRPLVDCDLSLAFYDMTTIRAEGLSTVEGDVRKFGMAKEGLIAKQFMLGVVQTADGLPIYHEVFDGNTAEAKTLLPILKKVMARFPNLRRLILVADRGLLSLDNLDELRELMLPSAQALEFILAVPGRRYSEFVELLSPLQQQCIQASAEITAEVAWNELRLVLAHDPAAALDQRQKRQTKINELQTQANAWVGKLDAQDQGAKKRGRKLSDSGAKARFYHEVRESHLGNIIKVNLKDELFSYAVDEDALKLAEMMDGKLLVVTKGVGRVDDVGLHHQVVVDEVSRIGVVGMDATDLGGGQVDLAGALFGKEGLHGGLVAQVELGMGAGEDVFRVDTLLGQAAHDGAADHAAVAGDKDFGGMHGSHKKKGTLPFFADRSQ
jgi:hypothetical protein